MTCTHHLWNDPTAACCTRTDAHDPNARGGHHYRDSHGSWLDAEREGRDGE